MSLAHVNTPQIVLALETSGDICGVAILRDGDLLVEYTFRHEMRLSERIMGYLDRALTESGLSLANLNLIAVGIGPGSFTGTRIGVMTAKTLSDVLGTPIAGINDLEAMALQFIGMPNLLVVPLLPCRAGVVFAAAYRVDGAIPVPILEPSAVAVDALLILLAAVCPEVVLFCGPAVNRYKETLESAGFTHCFGAGIFPRAADIGVLAAIRFISGRVEDAVSLVPLYIAPPPITLPKDRRGLTAPEDSSVGG